MNAGCIYSHAKRLSITRTMLKYTHASLVAS
jgi:hypothetical protein